MWPIRFILCSYYTLRKFYFYFYCFSLVFEKFFLTLQRIYALPIKFIRKAENFTTNPKPDRKSGEGIYAVKDSTINLIQTTKTNFTIMKKIYMIAAAALVAAAANAQNGAPLYITGAGTGFANGSWNAETPDQFRFENNEYVYDGTDLSQFKISTAAGSWDVFNPAALEANVTENDVWTALTPAADPANAGNISTPYVAQDPKKGTIYVKADLSEIKVNMISPKEEGFIKVFLRGEMNNWGDDLKNEAGEVVTTGAELRAAWEFTTTDGITYTFSCKEGQEILAGQGFKIADANWDIVNYGCPEEIEMEVPYVCNYNDQANMMLAEDWNGSVTLVINEPKGPAEVTFSSEPVGAVEGIEVDNNAAAVYYNLQGVRVANPENGLFIVVKGGKATKAIVK